MAGVVLVTTPIDKALPGVITQRALSADQGPSLWCHGNVPGHSDRWILRDPSLTFPGAEKRRRLEAAHHSNVALVRWGPFFLFYSGSPRSECPYEQNAASKLREGSSRPVVRRDRLHNGVKLGRAFPPRDRADFFFSSAAQQNVDFSGSSSNF